VLSNKRAVITGGSSGIGFAIAKAFAKNNANLVLIARNEKRLKESASILSQYGGEITMLEFSNYQFKSGLSNEDFSQNSLKRMR